MPAESIVRAKIKSPQLDAAGIAPVIGICCRIVISQVPAAVIKTVSKPVPSKFARCTSPELIVQ